MSQESGFRWGVEKFIALLGAGGGLVAILIFFGLGRGSKSEAPTPTAGDCFLAGTIFDSKNQALASTAVGFRATDGSFSFLAASLANGHYESTCGQVTTEKLTLQLSRVEWGGCVITPDNPKEVPRGHFDALNIRAPALTQCTKVIPTAQLSQMLTAASPVTVPVTTVPARPLKPGVIR